MDKLWTVVMVFALVVTVRGQVQQGVVSQCINTFNANAMQCLQNASLTMQQLRWLTSNGMTGAPPPGNPETLQTPYLQLMNSTVCANQLDRRRLTAKAAEIFGGLEMACSHPCRRTLMDEFRQCYTFNSIDPKSFVASEMFGKGGLIGSTLEDVYHFCSVRMNVMQCIRQKAQLCPESTTVLRELGLDMQSMQQGVEILCGYPKIYLAGVRCFSKLTPEVEMCRENAARRSQTIQLLRLQGLGQQRQAMEMCNMRLEQVDCEVGAWSRRQHESCDMAVVGLRNELECKTMPQHCHASMPQLVQRLCNQNNFHINERWRYGSASGLAVTWSTLVLLLVGSLLWNGMQKF